MGTIEIVGDIVGPTGSEEDWGAGRDFRYAYLDLECQRTSASQSPCREGLDSAQNQLWQSRVSIWETLSLHRKGRLKIPEGFSTWVTRAMTTMPRSEAPLTFEVAEALSTIHLPHSGPADLFLAASA